MLSEHVQQSLFLPEGYTVFAPEGTDIYSVIPGSALSLMREWIDRRSRLSSLNFKLYKEFFLVRLNCPLSNYDKWKHHLEMKDKIIKAFG